MFSRRVLRIKAYQALYAHEVEGHSEVKQGLDFIKRSIANLENYYYIVLSIPTDIKHYIITEGNPSEIKYLPTKQDIESGNTFIYNQLIEMLEKTSAFSAKKKKLSFNWLNHKDFLRKIFYEFKTGKTFEKFIANGEKTFDIQKKLISDFFSEFLVQVDDFHQLMEEDNMGWTDDRGLVMNMIAKTIDAVEEGSVEMTLHQFEEGLVSDIEFSTGIFTKTVAERDLFKKMISEKTQKWDTDRIAQSDLILMEMALCEMMRFPEIPIKVTINEYLDIAKLYSTPKSHIFINGILDKLMNELRENGSISKQGRGLVEN